MRIDIHKITINHGQFKANVAQAVKAGLNASAAVLADTMVRSLGSNHGGVPSAPGGPPNSQTGFLRNSVAFSEATDLHFEARAGTLVKYGAYLEFGAHIKPRNGRAIAIPMSDTARMMLRRAGGRARSVINALKFDKSKPLRFIKVPSGRLIVRSLGKRKGARSELLFLITKKAYVRPRPWIRAAVPKCAAKMRTAFLAASRAVAGVA